MSINSGTVHNKKEEKRNTILLFIHHDFIANDDRTLHRDTMLTDKIVMLICIPYC